MCCSGERHNDRGDAVEDDGCSYYHILGIPPTATLTEITKAYHVAARLYHPDRRHLLSSQNPSTESKSDGSIGCSTSTNLVYPDEKSNNEMFLRVQKAWECLRCPERRQAYDTKRRQEQIQREQRLRSALPVERDDCVERIVLDCLEDDDYNCGSSRSSNASERVVELVFSCRCGQELWVSEADPDDHNLLTCDGCSLLYDTTPVWNEEEVGVLVDDN